MNAKILARKLNNLNCAKTITAFLLSTNNQKNIVRILILLRGKDLRQKISEEIRDIKGEKYLGGSTIEEIYNIRAISLQYLYFSKYYKQIFGSDNNAFLTWEDFISNK
jgi:hypothetical protein